MFKNRSASSAPSETSSETPPETSSKPDVSRPPGIARVLSLVFVLSAVTTACGTYEPPKPGIYRGLGVANPDLQCGYETPTGSNFVSMRCRRTEDVKAQGAADRSMADSIPTRLPQIP